MEGKVIAVIYCCITVMSVLMLDRRCVEMERETENATKTPLLVIW